MLIGYIVSCVLFDFFSSACHDMMVLLGKEQNDDKK